MSLFKHLFVQTFAKGCLSFQTATINIVLNYIFQRLAVMFSPPFSLSLLILLPTNATIKINLIIASHILTSPWITICTGVPSQIRFPVIVLRDGLNRETAEYFHLLFHAGWRWAIRFRCGIFLLLSHTSRPLEQDSGSQRGWTISALSHGEWAIATLSSYQPAITQT